MLFVVPNSVYGLNKPIFIDREIMQDTPSSGFLSCLRMNKLPEVQLSVIVESVSLSMKRFARGMRKYNSKNIFK